MAGMNRQVIVQLLADTTRFSGGMNRAIQSTNKLGDATGGAAGKLGALKTVGLGVGIGLAGGIAAGVRAFAGFEDKLNQSLAIMGSVSDEMKQSMSDTARQIAKETRFGADQAAEAYFFLASAGLDAEQSIAALPQVAAFAQAGMFDLATATDLATDAQSALGLASKDPEANLRNLTRVTDVFVKANTLANTSVQQVSEAMTNKLGGSLRAVGIDIEEGTAVLAAFADQGIKGAAAGEALNIVYRDLSRAARENEDAFKEAGIAVFDEAGNFRNTADIVRDLEGAFGGLTAEQQANLATQLGFQDRSFKNIQLLFGTADAIERYEEQLRSASGITEEVAGKQMQSLSAQFDVLKSEVTDVAIGLGEDLAPMMADIIPAVISLAQAFGVVVGAIGDLVKVVAGPLGKSFRAAGDGVKWLTQEIQGLFGNEAADAAGDLTLAMFQLRRSIDLGKEPAAAFANSLLFLTQQGTLTKEGLDDLAESTEFVGEQYAVALREVRDLAVANGDSEESIRILNDALLDEVQTLIDLGVVGEDMIDTLGLTALAQERAATASEEMGDAAVEAGDDLEVEAEAAMTLEEALRAAIEAQESLGDVLKSAADPAFAAVKAWQAYQEKLEEINEDGEVTREEQLALAESIIATQMALDDLNADGLKDAVEAIAIALGVTTEEVEDLLTELGILDGKTVKTVIEVDLGGAGAGLVTGGGLKTSGRVVRPELRAEGGPVTAGRPYIVGEEGMELFVPRTSGMIAPIVNNTSTASSSKSVTINIDRPQTSNLPNDLAYGALVAGLIVEAAG